MHVAAAAAANKLLQSCLTLCDPIDGSPPGFSVPGILQARTLERVAISFSNACMHAKLLQSCLTLCDPVDSSPPGSSVHRILQARILEKCMLLTEKSQYGKIYTMWFKLCNILVNAELWSQCKYQWLLRSRKEGGINIQSKRIISM